MDYPNGFFSGYHAQKPICGVLSVALCAGVTYEVASEACKVAMKDLYPNRQRFGGKTTLNQQELVLKRFGVKYNKTVFEGKGRPRLMAFAETCKPDTIYSIIYASHVITVKNGMMMDQGMNMTVAEFATRYKNPFLKSVLEITGKGW